MSAMDSAVASSNEFSFKLHRVCRNADPRKNLFYSPASIAICLSMLKTGAKEDTLKQIEGLLSNGEDRCSEEGFAILSKYLQEKSGPITLKTSNILAVDQQFVVQPEFLDNLKLNYNSEIKQLPFQTDPEKSRKEINGLIEEATNGKIKDTFDSDSISRDSKLVLANAIYFNGDWKNKFERMVTRRSLFYRIYEQKILVDMMFKKQSYKYTHSEDLNADMIEIPYEGETVSLIILLPSERYGLPLLEKDISVPKLNHAIEQLRMQESITLGLPKFKLEENISLNEHLRSLGMTEAFSNTANFSGISSQRNLYVSNAFHKTFLDVNEDGTEAAAVTAIVMRRGCSLPPPSLIKFTVDHPFMIFIRESTTGLILFTGSVQKL